MTESYQIVERLPTIQEYIALCLSVGWAENTNFDAAKVALPCSLYAVVALHDDKVVGMGRVVGDGAIFFYIQDIAVHPVHQRKGVGTRIMNCLLEYIRVKAPKKAFVGLFAAGSATAFYAKFGFYPHPEMTGMFQTTPLRQA
jgi:GNAT superfamily N-acetyltransferase